MENNNLYLEIILPNGYTSRREVPYGYLPPEEITIRLIDMPAGAKIMDYHIVSVGVIRGNLKVIG